MGLLNTKTPYKIYAEVLEATALEQFENTLNAKGVVQGALMSDAHTGYTAPIGTVVAVKGFVYPSWVGFDIGCGMCALKLPGVSKDSVKRSSKRIFDAIYESIPVGFNSNITDTEHSLEGLTTDGKAIATRKKYKQSLGSLGSGNHFIELGIDEEGSVWVVIHSGSRGVGHGLASHYMRLAASDPKPYEEEFDKNNENLLKHNPTNYERIKAKYVTKKLSKVKGVEGHHALPVTSQYGKDYIQDLDWALDYALANRKEMMKRVVGCVSDVLELSSLKPNFQELINRNHNHVVYKDGLWIHRKGATHAEEGMLGVIPGNMRDGSFIVVGKGNPDSLCSSSHGAGRVLGRMAAKRSLSMDDFTSTMAEVTASVTEDTIDESPFAYKNIFEVMELQKDLVDVIAHVTPIINIKG